MQTLTVTLYLMPSLPIVVSSITLVWITDIQRLLYVLMLKQLHFEIITQGEDVEVFSSRSWGGSEENIYDTEDSKSDLQASIVIMFVLYGP